MIEILVAILVGFAAGIIGSLATHEALQEKLRQKIDADMIQYARIEKELREMREHNHLSDTALQQTVTRFTKERGAIWQSLNGLWNDYDERHKQAEEQPVEAEPEEQKEEPKKETKKKEGKKKDGE